MEYKGFTYTPIPKTAWDNLSMLEKSEMMKVAVRNGITDLKTIREKYNEFAEGGGMEGSMNTIPEDYAPLASPTWQPAINKMKQDSYKSNVEDFAYRVQKMHPEITQQQVEEAYKSVPIIASDSRRGRELGKYVFGDESGYGQRIMLYPNRMKEDQGVGGLTKEDQLRSAMGHETNHLYVHTLLGDNHTDEEKALLDAAYPDDLFHVPEGGNIYDEKRAYNMQVRNALSKSYGNVVGADYDKATEKMKPNDVMWNYSQLGSGYMSDYQKVKQKYKKGSKWDQNQVDAILKATKDVAYTPTVNPYEYEEGVNYAALGGSLIEDAMNRYRDGGSIHIKPSHRGRLTELKKRTGKTEAELYRTGSPATRKMITFARNARKWKHGLGGNLFSGEEEGSQKMQIGLRVTNDWKPFTLGDVLANAARIEQQKQALENRFSNDLILSNDATSVTNGRSQNRHLERKAVEGAKVHAAWEKEHPILNTVGLGLSTIPFVAAASPILAPAGEAFAGTTLAGVSAPMWTDAALTSGFGVHGLHDLANGNADWMTALEVAPLGRLAKPIFNETAIAIENYRYPLGRPQVPDGYLTIKPQLKSYNNSITEVPFFTWGNDSRFKVSPTEEFYKDLHSQLSAAKKYKESPEYADLVRKAAQESEKLGIGDFPEDLFTAPNGKSLKLIFENRPKGQLGEYVPEDNVMRLDMLQSDGMEVPYHEGIHWQRVGNPDNIGPNFSKWWKARKSGQSDDVQQKLFENFRNSEEYNRYIKRRNADRYLEYKVDNALYPFADDYLRARGELQAHGLEAGRAIGLKPFLPYPGMKSALNAIDKARGYNPYLNDVKSGGEENVKRFWNILTGQYAPSLIPLGLVGTGYGLTNK